MAPSVKNPTWWQRLRRRQSHDDKPDNSEKQPTLSTRQCKRELKFEASSVAAQIESHVVTWSSGVALVVLLVAMLICFFVPAQDSNSVGDFSLPPSPLQSLLNQASHTSAAYKAPLGDSRRLHDAPSMPDVDLDTERFMDIYARGSILHTIQSAGVFADSKHFVDMPLKRNTSVFEVLLDFQERHLAMTEYRAHSVGSDEHIRMLREFLDDHFDPPGSDLLPITPIDYQELQMPSRIAAIQDDELRDWAFDLHRIWRTLGRVPKPQVQGSYLHPKRLDKVHKHPQNAHRAQDVLMVPGGRFRESYYWDSFWIVQGLLVSEMNHTARSVVSNFLEYVDEFGFIPNGGRIYYLTRSHPPLLSEMIRLVAQVSYGHDPSRHLQEGEFDLDYLNATVPLLEKEYAFWMQRGPCGHAVELPRQVVDGNGIVLNVTYVLNRYTSNANFPRPEAYREDISTAEELFKNAAKKKETSEPIETFKTRYYNNIIAAAESGWDFSSRWMRDHQTLRSVFTDSILPVDLNAILYRMERNLMDFHLRLGNADKAEEFQVAAAQRLVAMDHILWSEEESSWKDLNMENDSFVDVTSISDFTPLWAGAFDRSNTTRLQNVVHALNNSGLLHVGGVWTTNRRTGQQWDAPNAWPPEQDIIVEGLVNVNTSESMALAQDLAKKWMKTSLKAWQQTGLMFEKYNGSEVGGLGTGGEYFPQFGFGWSNGIILKFLTKFQYLLQP